MITVPPRTYCVIENPVLKDKDGNVLFDKNGQVKLAFADLDFRFSRDPFPLYPGEVLKQVTFTFNKIILSRIFDSNE